MPAVRGKGFATLGNRGIRLALCRQCQCQLVMYSHVSGCRIQKSPAQIDSRIEIAAIDQRTRESNCDPGIGRMPVAARTQHINRIASPALADQYPRQVATRLNLARHTREYLAIRLTCRIESAGPFLRNCQVVTDIGPAGLGRSDLPKAVECQISAAQLQRCETENQQCFGMRRLFVQNGLRRCNGVLELLLLQSGSSLNQLMLE
jgi:hypothetical protein